MATNDLRQSVKDRRLKVGTIFVFFESFGPDNEIRHMEMLDVIFIKSNPPTFREPVPRGHVTNKTADYQRMRSGVVACRVEIRRQ